MFNSNTYNLSKNRKIQKKEFREFFYKYIILINDL